MHDITAQRAAKHAFLVKTKKKSKLKSTPKKESFFGIIASDIRTQVQNVTNAWIYYIFSERH